MKITKIETIEHMAQDPTQRQRTAPRIWTWVRIHTSSGLVGLGETYSRTGGESAAVHHGMAHMLLGQDAGAMDRLWKTIFDRIRFYGWAGAEIRALSAVDIALWDLLGKRLNAPLYQLLGGASRDRIPIYNTCFDHRYDFLHQAGELARDLLDCGITTMKIWPFDRAARASGGSGISAAELREALRPFEQIRAAVGDAMEIAAELHGLWSLPGAIQIAAALEPFNVRWIEDPMPQDHLDAFKTLAQHTSIPIFLSERLLTRYQYRELLARECAQCVIVDVEWTGGISEAKKIATMAEAYLLPIAPHNGGGPILHQVSAHLAANVPNLFALESVRSYYESLYDEYVTHVLKAQGGFLPLPEGPGLGTELREEVLTRDDVRIWTSQ